MLCLMHNHLYFFIFTYSKITLLIAIFLSLRIYMSNIKGSHYSEEDIQNWGVNDVAQWLISLKLDSCVNDFMSAHIDGQRLLV